MKTATATTARKIDWQRIASSLYQRFRREQDCQSRIPQAIEHLKNIVSHTERDVMYGRRALRNMGTALATTTGTLRIISPVCLSISSGSLPKPEPSELAQKHRAFLEGFGDALPPWHVTFLFPPPEREDPSAEDYIRRICELTNAHFAGDTRVTSVMMTSYAPGMIADEERVIEEIVRDEYLSRLCAGLMLARSPYYRSIGIPSQFWLRRTRRTMAQYIILGRLATLSGSLMCNHTSVNIHCAIYAGAGVLHNPVGFR